MSKRLLYIVLTATLLVASAVAASLPAAAQLGGIGDNVTKTFCETTGQLELPGNCPLPTTPTPPRRAAVVAVAVAESFPVAVVAVAHPRLRRLPPHPLRNRPPSLLRRPCPTTAVVAAVGSRTSTPTPVAAAVVAAVGRRREDDNPRGGNDGRGGGGGEGKGDIPELRNPDGSPSRSNPTLTETPGPGQGAGFLPGPSTATSVPNFIIEKFRVPIFLLPIYQAAGTQYGVRWEVLAAINEIETDYGRNLNVSYAGALGWMQFIPSSWRAYGVDANKDGVKDPYNPVDAIFAAARYLDAAGYSKDPREAIFAYNHADWYVDSVLMRARLIAGVPGDLTGSLTGLTEGRFPVYAKARYADDVEEPPPSELVARSGNAAQLHSSDPSRRGIEIYTREGAPVVAVNDGEVTEIGRDRKGQFVVLQDVYGNRYSYRGLSEVADSYPVPKSQPRLLDAAGSGGAPAPDAAASAGRQPDGALHANGSGSLGSSGSSSSSASSSEGVEKQRLFAHPDRKARDPRRLRVAAAAVALRPGGADGEGLRHLQGAVREALLARPRGHPPGAAARGLTRRRRARSSGRVGTARPGQGRAPLLRDPAGRPRRPQDRPEADPRRLEAARGDRDLPRPRPERAPGRDLGRPAAPAVEAAARAPRPRRLADRGLRLRPRGHPDRPDRPPRPDRARLPRRVGPATDGHEPASAATPSTPRPATSRTTPPATPPTSRS